MSNIADSFDFSMLQGAERIIVIGTIASGKTRLTESISESTLLEVHRLDDARRSFDASTMEGEVAARESFLNKMVVASGVFECTGAGPLYPDIVAISSVRPFDVIIRVHTPVNLCVERCQERREWPPYPIDQTPSAELIRSIDDELNKHGFTIESGKWNGQKLIHVRGW